MGAWLLAGLGLSATSCGRQQAPIVPVGPIEPVAKPPARSRVVAIHDSRLERSGLICNRKALEAGLDEGMLLLTGEKTVEAAWRKFFSSDEKVGIKPNGLAAPQLGTTTDLINLVIERLVGIGVKAERIVVWEQLDSRLRNSGLTLNRSTKATRYLSIAGDFGDPTSFGQFNGRFGKVVEEIDAIVNLPVLKHHDLTGFTGALKNHFGSIDDPAAYHANGCDPFVAQVSAHPTIRKKSRLVIFDAMRGQYDKGPQFREEFGFAPGELLLSADPVAVDAQAAAIIAKKRAEMKLPALGSATSPVPHIHTAALYGLGNEDPARIELVRKDRG